MFEKVQYFCSTSNRLCHHCIGYSNFTQQKISISEILWFIFN